MSLKKKSIIVLCGGQSAEHEISILSARNIVNGLDHSLYDVFLIYLSQQGCWYLVDPEQTDFSIEKSRPIAILPGLGSRPFALLHNLNVRLPVDCVIPVLHGTLGEDGAIQGLLDILKVPYVGCDSLSSANCMNKYLTKQLLSLSGLPVVEGVLLTKFDESAPSYSVLEKQFGSPFFLKPVDQGSSVGTAKISNENEFNAALTEAFCYTQSVLVERFIKARELECSVLGNENPKATLPGELKTSHTFYSYEAKYVDESATQVVTPADVDSEIAKAMQRLAIEAFTALKCSGMARVDFFLSESNEIYINELNTIPGFTNISMYPKNWAAAGISLTSLLNTLIELAIQRFERGAELSHQYGKAIGAPVGQINE